MIKTYTFQDLKQAIIGSFIAVVVFLAIRGGNPFFFNPTYGIIISVLIVWIYWKGFNIRNDKIHFLINLSIAFLVCATMSYVFEVITIEEILSKKVFGSLAIIAWWVAIPLALLFDRYNFTNPLRRYYVRGR